MKPEDRALVYGSQAARLFVAGIADTPLPNFRRNTLRAKIARWLVKLACHIDTTR